MTVPKLITRQLLFSNIPRYHILLLQDTDIVGFFIFFFFFPKYFSERQFNLIQT